MTSFFTDNRDALRTEFSERRLRLGGLPPHARVFAVIGVAAVVATSLGILVLGTGRGVHGRSEYEGMSSIVLLGSLAGQAVAAGLLTVAAAHRRRLFYLLVVAVRTLVVLRLAAYLIWTPNRIRGNLADDATLDSRATTVAGWCIAALAVLGLAITPRLCRSLPRTAGGVTALPFVVAGCSYVLASGTPLPIDEKVFSYMGWPSAISPRDLVVDAVVSATAVSVFAAVVLVCAQVVTGVRASRDVALVMHRLVRKSPAAPWVLVIAKVVFILLGLVGLVHHRAGDALRSVRSDGWVSLAIAAAVGVVVMVGIPRLDTLGHKQRQLADRRAFTWSWALVAAVVMPLAASSVFDSVGVYSEVFSNSDASDFHLEAAHTAAFVLRWSPSWWIAVLLVALTVASIRRSTRSVPVIALAMAVLVWCGPRLGTVLADLFGYPDLVWRVGLSGDYLERSVPVTGWVDPVTLDVAVTAAVGILVLMYRRRAPWIIDRCALLLVLATILTYTGLWVPQALRHGYLFYIALVFPVVYAFMLDSEALNRAADRASAVVLALGATTFALAVTVMLVADTTVSPDSATGNSVIAEAMLKVPLVVPVVMLTLMTVRPLPIDRYGERRDWRRPSGGGNERSSDADQELVVTTPTVRRSVPGTP